jgi:predicted DNA-binding transcriptional regulator AlpA
MARLKLNAQPETAATTAPHVLRTDAAAKYVGLSPPTLEKLRLRNNGPIFCKLGRAIGYLRADLDTWLSDRRRQSTSET